MAEFAHRRGFLRVIAGATVAYAGRQVSAATPRPPNVILIFADDLGYGDLGSYGSRIPTPNLDRMAADGMRWTQFYSASPVCSPSRAAVMTGRYPVRTGVHKVLMPSEKLGLPQSETTIATLVKKAGYRTACVGKWHLGTQTESTPNQHGFDEYFGLPYSNDMLPLPLLHNSSVVEELKDHDNLALRYTKAVKDFIAESKSGPFFVYFAPNMPHIPLAASSAFKGKSGLGPYGDAVMELDWSVGEILKSLKDHGIEGETLVLFTSDNGPWYQGSSGPLQGRKGSTYEGGVREPFLAYMPGRIQPGSVCGNVGSTVDLLPTIARLAGLTPTASMDGIDLWPLLSGETEYLDREALLFFDGWNLQCARWGPYKLHFSRYNSIAWTPDPAGGRMNLPLPRPELYDVVEDPGESYDLSEQKAKVVERITANVDRLMAGLPDHSRNAWRETMRHRVQDTPAGALPREDR